MWPYLHDKRSSICPTACPRGALLHWSLFVLVRTERVLTMERLTTSSGLQHALISPCATLRVPRFTRCEKLAHREEKILFNHDFRKLKQFLIGLQIELYGASHNSTKPSRSLTLFSFCLCVGALPHHSPRKWPLHPGAAFAEHTLHWLTLHSAPWGCCRVRCGAWEICLRHLQIACKFPITVSITNLSEIRSYQSRFIGSGLDLNIGPYMLLHFQTWLISLKIAGTVAFRVTSQTWNPGSSICG